VTLNDIPENREQFDLLERALTVDRRERLLRKLGPKAEGLRVWAFGAGWQSRSIAEIPVEKIAEFAKKYA
jgi:hypothetical protein